MIDVILYHNVWFPYLHSADVNIVYIAFTANYYSFTIRIKQIREKHQQYFITIIIIMSYRDWDYQREYSINEIIAISRKDYSLFEALAMMSIDMKVYGNVSALDVYNNIITNPSEYPILTDAEWIMMVGYVRA